MERLKAQDGFLKLVGAELLEAGPGRAVVRAVPTADHCNFNGVVHGGYIFSLADIAFAYASNLAGRAALALDMYISFRRPARPGVPLVAEAREVDRRGRTALYSIWVREEGGEAVAVLQSTVYITDREPGGGCHGQGD